MKKYFTAIIFILGLIFLKVRLGNSLDVAERFEKKSQSTNEVALVSKEHKNTQVNNSLKKIGSNIKVIANCLTSSETGCDEQVNEDKYHDPNLSEKNHELSEKLNDIRNEVFNDNFQLHTLDSDSLIASISINNPNISLVALDLVLQKRLNAREKKSIIRSSQKLDGKNYIQVTNTLLREGSFERYQKLILKGLNQKLASRDLHTSIEILRKLPHLAIAQKQKEKLIKTSCHHIKNENQSVENMRMKSFLIKVNKRVTGSSINPACS